jgi:small subunit ribosomal protein S3
VWLYKGDVLPYKAQTGDKISREAAMAVGETSGTGAQAGGQRRVVSSSAGRGRPGPGAPAEEPAENEPLIKEADPELERLLAEEEEIERRVTDHSETPHFRPGDE